MPNIFSKYNHFFKSRPILNLFIALIYFLLVVLPHEEVGKIIAALLDEPLGRSLYNKLILGFGTAGFLGYLWLVRRGVFKFPERKKPTILYLSVTLLLIILTINILMVINVEMIHFVQYAIMAILLFPLFSNFGNTLFFTIFLGALDEAYQYWVLAPFRTDYYDFNDVIINLLGAALGLILLFSNGLKTTTSNTKILRNPVTLSSLILLAIFAGLYSTGKLAIFPNAEGNQAPILLVRKVQPGFWTIVPPEVKFHVLRPLAGLVIGLILFQFYKALNKLSFT